MANFTMQRKVILPPHPDTLDPIIAGLYRPQLLELLGCSRSVLMSDHRALRTLNKTGLIDFNYPERSLTGYYDRRQVELLLLLRRSTVTKSAHHAIQDVIKYANK